MELKNYQILFLDIDGTILRPDHTIEESTRQAIAELKKKGLEVALATGRPLHEIMETANELNIDSFITYNGSFAIYKGQEIFKEYMKPELVTEYLSIAAEQNHDLILYAENETLVTSLDSHKSINFLNYFKLTEKTLFKKDDTNRILSMTILTNDSEELIHYPKQEGIFLSQVNVEGMERNYDVITENVNKGVAVKSMLKHLKIPKELSIAFGDGMNDKEMLSIVGEGFAMGNGHPDLFKYAKHITTDVHHSGVYNGLRKLGLVN